MTLVVGRFLVVIASTFVVQATRLRESNGKELSGSLLVNEESSLPGVRGPDGQVLRPFLREFILPAEHNVQSFYDPESSNVKRPVNNMLKDQSNAFGGDKTSRGSTLLFSPDKSLMRQLASSHYGFVNSLDGIKNAPITRHRIQKISGPKISRASQRPKNIAAMSVSTANNPVNKVKVKPKQQVKAKQPILDDQSGMNTFYRIDKNRKHVKSQNQAFPLSKFENIVMAPNARVSLNLLRPFLSKLRSLGAKHRMAKGSQLATRELVLLNILQEIKKRYRETSVFSGAGNESNRKYKHTRTYMSVC